MKFAAIVGAVITLSASSSAFAALTEYTDATAFYAAAGSTTTYGFSGLTPDDSDVYYHNALAVGPATFEGQFVFAIGANAGFATYGEPFLSMQADSGTGIVFSPTSAFGFHYGSYHNAGDTLEIQIAGANPFFVTLPSVNGETTNFLGFTSSTPISGIGIVDQSNFQVTDITDFTIAGVPEPSTWGMLILGFAGLGFAGCRRAKVRSVPFVAA